MATRFDVYARPCTACTVCVCVCVLTYVRTCACTCARAASYAAAASVRVCVCISARTVRTRAPTRLYVGESARACVRGGARVSVSHLTTTRVIRATVATSKDDAMRAGKREYRRKSCRGTRGFIARRSRRAVAQNRFILSARSARRTVG